MTPRAVTPRNVLGLFAHPDDETFGPGATLARLAAEGHQVHLLTATRGEAGTIGHSASLGRQELASVRHAELVAACVALGIHPPEILALPDSGLARLDEETLLRPFVRKIRAVRPDVIMSFHAEGISGHLDHRTVTARAHTAFEQAADPNLWPYLGAPFAVERFWAYSIPESRARRITTRRLFAVPDDAIDAILDVRAYVGAKKAAVAAHASQKPFIDRLEQDLGGLDEYWAQESFVLATARTPLTGKRPVHDLFEGMP
jgi:LmbE family N-acetylglucosaminyl deacetylase